ncbi:hypothetical protein THAOC_16476 [Thalassiosira oceanica]|uniref:Uncharacterized protein n=1 Tax=Thalassiosira oceanica TaxID=159749 RepID=K0S9Q8_THAOC|nr:hypothetical protein THAOC_16476 [Thalassiosira oceanica]|eukprot:EJK62893.1 hypothetical protein THAOC_16476 [Thalassiosira oceanica]
MQSMQCSAVPRNVMQAGMARLPTGHYDANPNLNTLIYECQCWDGKVRKYAANIIAETDNVLKVTCSFAQLTCTMPSISAGAVSPGP